MLELLWSATSNFRGLRYLSEQGDDFIIRLTSSLLDLLYLLVCRVRDTHVKLYFSLMGHSIIYLSNLVLQMPL